MTLKVRDKWVWDFWFAQDGADYHIYYLQAPKSLKHEHLRHWHVNIGHAVSQDLTKWQILPDALAPSNEKDTWDNYTTWTGSIIQHAGTWYMFYTGSNREEEGKYQRIGLATSTDLVNWQKFGGKPLIEPDPQWYETYDPALWIDQAWRDPWVFFHEGKFHAYITARSNTGEKHSRGVVGHAISVNLLNWELSEPIIPSGEFAYLEVPQLVDIQNRWYLLFSVSHNLYSKTRRARAGVKPETGTHYFVADHPLGPFESLSDEFLMGDTIGSKYSGKIIRNPQGEWVLMAFHNFGQEKQFIGELSNPMPIRIDPDGAIHLTQSAKDAD